MSFRSIIRFQVKPGEEAAFEAAFEKAGMLVRPKRIDGFIDAQLVRATDAPATGEASEYFVVGRWRSEQAYADWQAVSWQTADPTVLEAMRATLIDHKPGRLFRQVLSSD